MAYKGIIRARVILRAVCQVFGITKTMMTSNSYLRDIKLARGIYCLVCYDEGIHPLFSSKVISRTRSNVVNITKHYKGYYDTRDKEVVAYYELVNKQLQDYARK